MNFCPRITCSSLSKIARNKVARHSTDVMVRHTFSSMSASIVQLVKTYTFAVEKKKSHVLEGEVVQKWL